MTTKKDAIGNMIKLQGFYTLATYSGKADLIKSAYQFLKDYGWTYNDGAYVWNFMFDCLTVTDGFRDMKDTDAVVEFADYELPKVMQMICPDGYYFGASLIVEGKIGFYPNPDVVVFDYTTIMAIALRLARGEVVALEHEFVCNNWDVMTRMTVRLAKTWYNLDIHRIGNIKNDKIYCAGNEVFTFVHYMQALA